MDFPIYCYVTNLPNGSYHAEVQNEDGEGESKTFSCHDKIEAMAWATTKGIMFGVFTRGGARFIQQ